MKCQYIAGCPMAGGHRGAVGRYTVDFGDGDGPIPIVACEGAVKRLLGHAWTVEPVPEEEPDPCCGSCASGLTSPDE